MALNQEFITVVKLNQEEAKNRLKELMAVVDELEEKKKNAANAAEIKAINQELKKARSEMKLYENDVKKTIDTLSSLSTSRLGDIEKAAKALKKHMKNVSSPEEYAQLNELLEKANERMAQLKGETTAAGAESKKLTDNLQNLSNVMSNINGASVNQLRQAQEHLRAELSNLKPDSTAYEVANAQLREVEIRLADISQEQKQVNSLIAQYEIRTKAAHKDMQTVRREEELIKRTLDNLDSAKVRDIEYSIKIISENIKDVEQGTEEYKKMTEQLKQLKTQLAAINDESKESKNWWTSTADFFNKNWGVITQGFAAITGLTMTVRKCVQSFADMEEAMADTRKYTGMTMEQVRDLNEAFKEMDTRTSREELNELAGAAGRLGLQAKQDVLDFVDAGNMIKVALGDDLGEGAIDQVGKLAMAFGEDDEHGLRDAMLKTGSAINELAQNSAAQAGYLVDFTARVGAFGKSIGLTQAQIMGFGAVLDENLLREEMSATAFGNMLTKMQTDTAKFAKIAGKDVKEFADLIKNDANAAILALADNMRKQDGETMMKMLDDMGLDGARAVGVLSTLADKIDDVRKHQETATKAYEEGRSVIEEYDVMNNTVQANLDKAKKNFHEITVELGQKLQPAAAHAITAGSLAIRTLSLLINFLTNNWKMVVTLTAGIVAYTIAVNKAVIMDKLHNAVIVIRNALSKVEAALIAAKTVAMTAYGIVVDLVTGKITLATAAQQLYNKVILANPYIAAAAAIMGITAALLHFIDSADDATEAQRRLNQVQEEAITSTRGEVAELSALVETAKNKSIADDARRDAIRKLQEKYPEYLSNLSKENINSQNAATAINNLTKALIEEAKARILLRKIQEAEEQKAALDEKYFSGISGIWEGIKAGWGSAINDLLDKTERVFNVVKYQSLDAFDMKTWVEENGYAINSATYLLQNYRAEVAALDQQIGEYNKELKQSIATSSNLRTNNPLNQNNDNGGGGTSGYKTEKELKAEERERKKAERARLAAQRAEEAEERKREAQKEKDFKKELKAEKAHQDALLLQNYLHFSEETHDLEAFRKEELRIRQASIDEQIAIVKRYHGEEASEVASLMKQKEQLQIDYNKTTVKLKEEELKHTAAMAKMQAERDFRTQATDIYADEAALQQKLSQIDLNALSERLELMKQQNLEGTAEYLQLQNEYLEKKAQVELDSELYLLEQVDRYREEYGNMSNEKQMQIELRGLEMLKKQALISEEEKQRMLMAIRAKYAKNPTQQKNEQFDNNVSDAISVAQSQAEGGYDKTQGMSLSNNPFVGQIQQYRSVMQQLKTMREQDKISHAEYEQAKAEVTSQFLSDMVAGAQAAYDSINNLMSAASSYYAAQSQYEQNVTSKKYDKMIEKAGNNQAKQKKLEEKKQKELAKIKTKYNKKAMKIELAQAVASTALAAINSYASAAKINWVLGAVAAAMATAAGMMQIAAIKKQHAAEEAGYYSGGFTGGSSYRKTAGVVHQGEFVVNHDGVNNQNLMPILRLFDRAQQNNTIGSLTAADVSQQLGQGGAIVAPVVNVQTDNETLNGVIGQMNEGLDRLNYNLENPTPNPISVEELDRKLDIFKRYKNNT